MYNDKQTTATAGVRTPEPVTRAYRSAPTRSITAGGVTFAYRELGPKGGVPVVFLLHLAANLDNWDPRIVDAIAEHRHVIAFDNRGLGASSGTVPDSVEAMADDAVLFVNALGFGKIDIFAFSLGGMVAQTLVLKHPGLVRKLVLAGTAPQGASMDKVAGVTYGDILRAMLTRSDPKEFLFFNRNATGKTAAKAFIKRLGERTEHRDTPVTIGAIQKQLKAIKKWGRDTPQDLSKITQPTLIANGDNDRMVESSLSENLHRRIAGSQLIIYPDSGHGGIFQFHQKFAPVAASFLDDQGGPAVKSTPMLQPRIPNHAGRPPKPGDGYPLAGKVVLLTGAGRGLGAATAGGLAREGAHVVIADRDLSGARATAASLPGGLGRAVQCDVTDPASVQAAVASAREEFGHIDVVIANAGIFGGAATLRSLRPGQAASVMAVNVDGVMNTVAATIEDVIASRGQFVLISSVFAYINGAGAIPYAMSKAAVEQLGRGLAVELAMHGASAMTAYFSLIDTDMVRNGVDSDPHFLALLSASPKFLLKHIKPAQAAAAIVAGIKERQRSLTVPARWRPVSLFRGMAAPVLDAKHTSDKTVHQALSDLENRQLAKLAPVEPTKLRALTQ